MAVYDSAKVRRAATLMKRLAGSMEADVTPGLHAAEECIGELRGKTATAMEAKLEELVLASTGLKEELGKLARQVGKYADMLEEADEQLARNL